jgi:hypothetical protein
MMAEIDERTITVMAVAYARYEGDRTMYAPNLQTPSGFHIGRSLPGNNTTPDMHNGALQLFLPHTQDVGHCERIIADYCDHAQIHPARLTINDGCVMGRGYWVRGNLNALRWLNGDISERLVMPGVIMVPPVGVEPPTSHGRVVVPCVDGNLGSLILRPEEMEWLRNVLTDNGKRPLLEHLDFNGWHLGTTDQTPEIEKCIATVRERFETSSMHNAGMTHFKSANVNAEIYPVVVL